MSNDAPPPAVVAGGDNRGRRRSTISAISHDFRRSMASNASTSIEERLHSHAMSTMALCSCVLTMFYLLMNVFPYSGFMAMQLVPGLTHESAGTYAGILSSSFMVGRAFSSYPWGKIADIYGRKFVLIVSLMNSALFSLAFGFSPTFTWALTMRFVMGLGNGIMLIARTSISELSHGNHELEARGMGLIMSMVGYGMLLAPAIGGALSEPMTQYPDREWFGGRFDSILIQFPFVLPNMIATLLSLISLVLVILCVQETLPIEKRRSVRYVLRDACRWIIGALSAMWSFLTRSVQACCCSRDTSSIWTSNINNNADYEQVSTTTTEDDNDDDADSIEDDLRILEQKDCSELSALLSSPASRASYTSALHRPSISATSGDKSKESTKSATIKSLLSKKTTRDCLFAYWLNSFANVAVNESFPLFCMSKEGGLGLSETQIGGIGTASGFLFCICQYFIFSFGMKKFGLNKSLVYASFLSNAPTILFPISLLLTGWSSLVFLSILMGVLMIFNSVFYANMTIVTNRTVEASHRATLNGLSSVGASVGRAGGPIFAGSLVAFSFSSVLFPAQYGSLLIYTVLAAIGLVACIFAYRLKDVDVQDATQQQPPPQRKESQEGVEIQVEGMNVITKDEEIA